MKKKIIISAPLPGIGDIGNTVQNVIQSIPGIQQVTPDKENGALGIEKKTNQLGAIGDDQNQAIAALQLYGYNPQESVAIARQMMAGKNLGEPASIYPYLTEAASIGAARLTNVKTYLPFVQYVLNKARGNTGTALGWLKTMAGYSDSVPGMNLFQLGVDSVISGYDPSALVYQRGLLDKEVNPTEINQFFNFIRNPNAPLSAEMNENAKIRHIRRVNEQLFEIKMSLAFGKMMKQVDKQVGNMFAGWVKGFETNPIVSTALKLASQIYRIALIKNLIVGSTGINGNSFLTDQTPSRGKTTSEAKSKMRIVKAASPVDTLTPQQGAPTTSTPLPVANGYPSVAKTDSLLEGKTVMPNNVSGAANNQMLELATKIRDNILPTLDLQLKSCKEYSDVITSQMQASEQTGDNYSLSVSTLGVDLADTPTLISEAAEIRNIASNAKTQILQYSAEIQKQVTLTQQNAPQNINQYTKDNATATLTGVATKLRSLLQQCQQYEVFAVFWTVYLPIKREVNKAQTKLKYYRAQREAWESDSTPFGQLMQSSIMPIINSEIAILRQIIGLNQAGIQAFSRAIVQEQGDKNIAAALVDQQQQLITINKTMEIDIQKLRNKMLSQDISSNQAGLVKTNNSFTDMIKTADTHSAIFNESLQEETISKSEAFKLDTNRRSSAFNSFVLAEANTFKKLEEEEEKPSVFTEPDDSEPKEETSQMFKKSDEEGKDYWEKIFGEPYAEEMFEIEKHHKHSK